jgi:tetratricopeptide (TPR) repeat protein
MLEYSPRVVLLVCLVLICSLNIAGETAIKAVSASEVLALVAGNALPQNIVDEIGRRGVNFHLDQDYQTQLKQTGADATILAALKKAKVTTAGPDGPPDKELLQHLTATAVLMQGNENDEAVAELSAALNSSFARAETGFVMGELLRRKEQWSRAAEIYTEVLRVDPEFPGAHTKLGFVLCRLGDSDGALHEARTALTQNPEDAEAHKIAGLALDNEQKFDAAVAEYKEALRLKPDYAVVHFDLGLLFYHMHNHANAIQEYKNAIALNPTEPDSYRNLAVAYQESGDIESAIRTGREAKRLSPNDPYIRQNLASALMSRDTPGAVLELREMEKLFPTFETAHEMLGRCLVGYGDIAGAEKEFRKAIELEPSDAGPYSDLGKIQEDKKNYDAALEQYRLAEKLNTSSSWTHADIGRILAAKKDFAGALAELKQAEALSPSDSQIHQIYAETLQASGNMDLAISELREASLDPKNFQAQTKLAAALEKKGDWVGAIEQYRRASLTEETSNRGHLPGEAYYQNMGSQKEFKLAQSRFEEHLAALVANGKPAEAAELKEKVEAMEASPALDQKVQLLMQSAAQAYKESRYEEAEKSYEEAVTLAEQLPQGNENLIEGLGGLGKTYGMRQNYKDAETVLHRQLTLVETTFGPESPRVTEPLASLGGLAGWLKDFVSAESYYSRALEINQKNFGENSFRTSESLKLLAGVYIVQKDYDKGEAYLIRAVKANEAMAGPEEYEVLIPLWGLCSLYDRWNKPEKSEPCWHRSTGILEKQYGRQSPNIVPALTNEAQALRRLGRTSEAVQLEKRSDLIRQVAGKTD